MIITSMKSLRSLKDVIIENGIKYTLYLLYFYLFDAISWIFLGSKKHIEKKHAVTCNENHARKNRWKRINQNGRKQRMRNNSNDKPLIEPQNAEKDFDSSRNQSSNGSNKTTNMPINYENIDSCISHTALKKPMDISTEKHSFNETQLPINISQDTEPFANKRKNVIRNKFPKSYTKKQRSNFCVNKGNARIFNQKFTSSDNMHSSSSSLTSFTSYKYRKSNQTNFVYNGEDSDFSNDSPTRPLLKKNKTKQRKELPIEFAPTNEKENFIFDEERNEKHPEQKNEKETQEGNFRRHGPTKYKSHYSRIPVINKKSKQNNLKYKEMGTQTDSAFSTDNAVEMVSVGTMWPEREIYGNATPKSQDTDMNQDVNCVNYISNYQIMAEKLLSVAYQLILSYNAPFSSADLGPNEPKCAAPDSNTAADLWSRKFTNNINTSETPTRTPPSFPEVSRDSPPSSIDDIEHIMLPSVKDEYIPKFCIKPATVAPPAPSPMRRSYYDYPELAKLPTYSNSSNVLY